MSVWRGARRRREGGRGGARDEIPRLRAGRRPRLPTRGAASRRGERARLPPRRFGAGRAAPSRPGPTRAARAARRLGTRGTVRILGSFQRRASDAGRVPRDAEGTTTYLRDPRVEIQTLTHRRRRSRGGPRSQPHQARAGVPARRGPAHPGDEKDASGDDIFPTWKTSLHISHTSVQLSQVGRTRRRSTLLVEHSPWSTRARSFASLDDFAARSLASRVATRASSRTPPPRPPLVLSDTLLVLSDTLLVLFATRHPHHPHATRQTTTVR